MKLSDIHIRDPFILAHGGKYYLYRASCPRIYVHISEDLENWSEPKVVFEKTPDFWADRDYWAPECHLYEGRFYLFVSFKSAARHRGTQILCCEAPDGLFAPMRNAEKVVIDVKSILDVRALEAGGYRFWRL